MSQFGSIDALINNAGIFIVRPFIDYIPEDFKALASTNLEGFIYISQLAIKQMLAQKTGGSIVSITGSLADHPIAGVKCFGCDDHEGWNLDRHAKSRDGICKEQHSRERGRAGSRRHPAAQKRFSECFNLYLYGRFRRIGVHGATNQRAQKWAMSLAVAWLMSGQQVGKMISVPWIVPITCRQVARTPLCSSSR